MNLKQFDECSEIIDWCNKNVGLLMRGGLLSDEIVNVCKAKVVPQGAKHITDIAVTRIVELSFI